MVVSHVRPALGGMGPRLRAGAVHGAVALWRERVDRFIDIVRAVENTPRGGEWTMEWTHRARGQRGTFRVATARATWSAAARRAVALAVPFRALAPGLPRGPENFELVPVSTGPVGA